MDFSPIFTADSVSDLAAAQFYVHDIVFQRQSHDIDFMHVFTYLVNNDIEQYIDGAEIFPKPLNSPLVCKWLVRPCLVAFAVVFVGDRGPETQV